MYSILVLISGAPRAGKNTLVNGMIDHFNSRQEGLAKSYSISKPIKKISHSLLKDLLPNEYSCSSPDSVKDLAVDCLNGHSFRDLYVHVGQMDQFSPGLWANECCSEILQDLVPEDFSGNMPMPGIRIIESVGKQPQFEAVMAHPLISMGFLQKVLVIHLERPGYNYTDNRTPIIVPKGITNLYELRIVNNGDESLMYTSAVKFVNQLCGE